MHGQMQACDWCSSDVRIIVPDGLAAIGARERCSIVAAPAGTS